MNVAPLQGLSTNRRLAGWASYTPTEIGGMWKSPHTTDAVFNYNYMRMGNGLYHVFVAAKGTFANVSNPSPVESHFSLPTIDGAEITPYPDSVFGGGQTIHLGQRGIVSRSGWSLPLWVYCYHGYGTTNLDKRCRVVVWDISTTSAPDSRLVNQSSDPHTYAVNDAWKVMFDLLCVDQ